ncbi:MAG: hypothetical protein COC01_08150, partial [Bacteroidetes bacterium]
MKIAILIKLMASIAVVLDTRKQKLDGTYPLKLRVTHNCISRDKSIKISIRINDWSFKKHKVKSSHPNYIKINQLLQHKRVEIESRLLDLMLSSSEFKVYDILGKTSRFLEAPNFKDFGYQIVNEYRDKNKIGTANSYKTAIDQLCNRLHKKITLSEIDYSLIMMFENKLVKQGVSVNGIANYMRHLKAIINRAIKSGYLKREDYPFHHYKIKTEKTRKRALSKVDFQKIMEQELSPGSMESEAREYFILIFCLIGINYIDLAYLKKEDLSEDRITYKRRKTKKLYDIPLSPRAMEIINLHRLPSSKYLLPILPDHELTAQEERAWTDNKLRLCNKYLKNIGKECKLQYPLTTYVARHS